MQSDAERLARAGQRRVNAFGQRLRAGRRHRQIPLKRAGESWSAEKAHAVAEVLPSLAARAAATARDPRLNRHLLPLSQTAHALAERDDGARGLVAENLREREHLPADASNAEVMQIRSADTDGGELDEYLTRLRRRHRHIVHLDPAETDL